MDSTYLCALPKDILVEHLCKLINNISFLFEMDEDDDPEFPEYNWTMIISFFNANLLIKGNWRSICWTRSRELNKFKSEGSVSIFYEEDNYILINKNNEHIHFSNEHIELDVPREYIETPLNNVIDELYKIALHLESDRCSKCNILTDRQGDFNPKCDMCKYGFLIEEDSGSSSDY